MLTCKNLFEISVYRLDESSYYNQMSDHISKVNGYNQCPLNEDYLKSEFGGGWRYNEIIGFLRFYRYGGNQIRSEYWETDAKNKVRTRKKRFIKKTDSYCNELFSASASCPQLAQSMKNAVDHCENRLRKRVLDRELFDNTVDFIDWKSVLN